MCGGLTRSTDLPPLTPTTPTNAAQQHRTTLTLYIDAIAALDSLTRASVFRDPPRAHRPCTTTALAPPTPKATQPPPPPPLKRARTAARGRRSRLQGDPRLGISRYMAEIHNELHNEGDIAAVDKHAMPPTQLALLAAGPPGPPTYTISCVDDLAIEIHLPDARANIAVVKHIISIAQGVTHRHRYALNMKTGRAEASINAASMAAKRRPPPTLSSSHRHPTIAAPPHRLLRVTNKHRHLGDPVPTPPIGAQHRAAQASKALPATTYSGDWPHGSGSRSLLPPSRPGACSAPKLGPCPTPGTPGRCTEPSTPAAAGSRTTPGAPTTSTTPNSAPP